MNVLFWNINKNNVLDSLFDISMEKNVDVIILIESFFNPNQVLLVLNDKKVAYHFCPTHFCKGIQLFSKFSKSLIMPIYETKRHTARNWIIPKLNLNVLLIIVHYQSKLRWSDSSQSAHSPELKQFISMAELKVGHKRTVVLGDFNMNPFEFGMVQTTGLHSTMSKDLATEQNRIVDGNNYDFFYNPMWSFYGEHGKGNVNGTFFYRKADPICYFWNIIDQVILKSDLLPYFNEESLDILTVAGKTKLLTSSGRIDHNVSDHLPVFFNFKF